MKKNRGQGEGGGGGARKRWGDLQTLYGEERATRHWHGTKPHGNLGG